MDRERWEKDKVIEILTRYACEGCDGREDDEGYISCFGCEVSWAKKGELWENCGMATDE